jgi:hypothetical protein
LAIGGVFPVIPVEEYVDYEAFTRKSVSWLDDTVAYLEERRFPVSDLFRGRGYALKHLGRIRGCWLRLASVD